jgi:hypothetical protein
MNPIESVYEKYQNLVVQPCYRKARKDKDFLIVMNDNLETFYLTATAKEMIETISSGISVDDLYQKFQEDYEVDSITLKSDILDFLKDMQWKCVVSLKASNSAAI